MTLNWGMKRLLIPVVVFLLLIPVIAVYADAHAKGLTEYMTISTTAASSDQHLELETITLATFAYDNTSVTQYYITASAGEGGSITPNGLHAVNVLDDHLFSITADSGNAILDVLVDGVSIGPWPEYTFLNVMAAHTISATFLSGSSGTVPGDGGSSGGGGGGGDSDGDGIQDATDPDIDGDGIPNETDPYPYDPTNGEGGDGGSGGEVIPVPIPPIPQPDWSALWNSGALFIIAIILLAIIASEINRKRKKNSARFRDSRGGSSIGWKSGPRYE